MGQLLDGPVHHREGVAVDKKFPVYSHHAHSVDAQCFNCGDWFDKSIGALSGFPQGRGAFYSECLACNMKTYYDINNLMEVS
jgi:hypothetical protein